MFNQLNPKTPKFPAVDFRLRKAQALIDRAKAQANKNGYIKGFKVNLSYDEINKQITGIMKIPSGRKNIVDCTIIYTGRTRETVLPGSIPLTGDPEFDYRLIIEGLNTIQLLTHFDSQTRKILKQLIKNTGRFYFTPLQIKFFIPITLIETHRNALLMVINRFINLTNKLYFISNVKKKLLYNSQMDTCPDVRINNLKALYENYSLDNDIKKHLAKTLFDPHIEVRAFAMKCLENYSLDYDIKKHLVKALFDPHIEVRTFAMKYLGEEGVKTIYSFIKSNPVTLYYTPSEIMIAIEMLANSEGEECSKALIDYCYNCKSAEIQKKIIKTLAKTKGQGVEKLLITMLHTDNRYFIEEVITSLSHCGTELAVMPLIQYTKKLFIPFDHKVMAQKAVAQIQSRLGSYEKGMLSIVESEEMDGALSFSEEKEPE